MSSSPYCHCQRPVVLLGLVVVVLVGHFARAASDGQKPAGRADSFAVPDGSVEQLLRFIDLHRRTMPPPKDLQAREAIKKAGSAIVRAADKVLAAKPSAGQAFKASEAKLNALLTLKQQNVPTADAQLKQLPDQLARLGWQRMARAVRRIVLQVELADAADQDNVAIEKAVAEVEKFLARGPLSRADVKLSMMAVQVLAITGKNKLTAETYIGLGKRFSAATDPALAEIGSRMQDAAKLFLLPGKKLTLEGTTVDGKPLDWSKYRGKVVLVMYWASWCKPCRREIPNVRSNYGLYRSRGFEVVSVSCDDNRENVEAFLKTHNIPWPVLFSDDPEKTGTKHPMATRYHVTGLPTTILVDRQGKIVTVQVRGQRLAKQLQRLLSGQADSWFGNPSTVTVGR